MIRCAFCHTLRAVLGDYCSEGCRERAMREGKASGSRGDILKTAVEL